MRLRSTNCGNNKRPRHHVESRLKRDGGVRGGFIGRR
jgi:hypothetical protein